jgi:hypothetical protein
VLQLEFFLCFYGIAAAADDGGVQFIELLEGVAELGRFVDSAWSIRFRIKVQDQVFAAIILQRNSGAAVVGHREIRSFVAYLEHLYSPGGVRAGIPPVRTAELRLRIA